MSRDDPVKTLLTHLEYTFDDPALLTEALTHRSFVNECGDPETPDNERFEFLGDAVIDLIVSTHLMENQPAAREGALSRARASLVNEAGLAKVARTLELGAALRLGRGEELTGGRERSSILADAFEALIAAVYLDGGLEAAGRVVERVFELPDVEVVARRDPKTELQERIQAHQHTTPTYQLVREEGPDHEKSFVVEILVDGEVRAEGQGRTKKDAERAAARALLGDLDKADR